MRSFILFCTFLIFPLAVQAQFSIGVNIMGLSYHLKQQANAQLYPYRIDGGGRMVVVSGIQLTIDVPLYRYDGYQADDYMDDNYVGIQAAVALFQDCIRKTAGFFHIGARGYAQRDRHAFGISFGPAWFVRQSWSSLSGYVDEGLFADTGRLQHSFYWYGGGLEHMYYLSEEIAVSTHLIPGIPEVLVLSSGMRITPSRTWINDLRVASTN
ncbi:MAG: hypothetical protein ACOCVC_05035 [Spirochaeta sp.]